MLGIGGTPEGTVAACAMKCLGGTIQGKLLAPGRRGAPAGPWTRASTSTGCSPPTTW